MQKYTGTWSSRIKSIVIICSVFLLAIAIVGMFNHPLTAHIIDSIAGIWTGVAVSVISRETAHSRYLGYRDQKRINNRISSKLIVVGIAVFLTAGLLGSGIVFSIDFTGLCPTSSLEAWLGETQGKIHFIVIVGAIFGMAVGASLGIWFEDRIYEGRWYWKVFMVIFGLPGVFFGYQFSRVFGSPYILASVISGIGSAILIMYVTRASGSDPLSSPILPANNSHLGRIKIFLQSRYSKIDLKQFEMHVFAVGLFLIPIAAYLSRFMSACPR